MMKKKMKDHIDVKQNNTDKSSENKENTANPEMHDNGETEFSATGVTDGNTFEVPVVKATDSDKVLAEVRVVEEKLAEMQDKYIRLSAEFDNYRRRSAKERLELIQTAGRDVITDMLDVLDDCDRAQKQLDNSDNPEAIKEGVMLVFGKLRNTLQLKGLKAMETINKEFDPDLHDAITEITAPTKELKGKILDEVMKGYYLNDKIIRHAKVVVGK